MTAPGDKVRIEAAGAPGTIVSLGGVDGDFVLTDDSPERLLFISAGSGITPIMSMLRHLHHGGELNDVVLLHSARRTDEVIFGDELRAPAERHQGLRLHEQLTREHGRISPSDLERLCPDWREREAFISGPGEMLDAFTEHCEGDCDRLHMERFQPKLVCHTCVGELRSGRVRDLRNGNVYGQDGEMIRTCVSAPEGPVEIDL